MDIEDDAFEATDESSATKVTPTPSVSTSCPMTYYSNGSCGCDAGSSCGYTRTKYVKQCICTAPDGSCKYCTCDSTWVPVETTCVASSSCTFC